MEKLRMEYFKTKSGTNIPIQKLKGKDYILVAHRLLWFREEHPGWTIQTEVIQSNDKWVTFKSSIKDESGREIQTGHKTEHFAHFGDALEKAETGAVGRALAMCGYGTQFAPELSEDDRIVDAPLDRPTPSPSPVKPVAAPLNRKYTPSHIDLEEVKALAKTHQWAGTAVMQFIKEKYDAKGVGDLDEKQLGELKFTIRNMTPAIALTKVSQQETTSQDLFTKSELQEDTFSRF